MQSVRPSLIINPSFRMAFRIASLPMSWQALNAALHHRGSPDYDSLLVQRYFDASSTLPPLSSSSSSSLSLMEAAAGSLELLPGVIVNDCNVVERVAGPAAEAGGEGVGSERRAVEANEIIVAVNGTPCLSLEHTRKLLARANKKSGRDGNGSSGNEEAKETSRGGEHERGATDGSAVRVTFLDSRKAFQTPPRSSSWSNALSSPPPESFFLESKFSLMMPLGLEIEESPDRLTAVV